LAVSCAVVVLAREPVNERLLQQLDDSSQQLYGVTEALLQTGPGGTSGVTPTLALEAAVAQANLHRQAVEELERTARQIGPEGFSLVQLAGGALGVLLIGALGLQRLQNLDSEIEGLRRSTSAGIRERVNEMRGMLAADVTQAVDKRFEATRDEMKSLTENFRTDTSDATNGFVTSAREAMHRVEESRNSLDALLARYRWLESAEMREIADEISELVSVEQAHLAATRFNREDDRRSARSALRRIVDENLPGGSKDFHNAHAEAMKMDDPQLALTIAEKGLESYPDQYDLMADRAIALISVGRVQEARTLLEDWRERKPQEFARGWRPVVFYADAAQASELTDEAVESVEAAMRYVTQRLPHESKPWAKYARFEIGLGRLERAEDILRKGLEYNRFGQELNYVLGELLLQQGRADESLEFLETALRTDYQEQYQHDVDQYAVQATLAQAYEAVGQLDKAELLYRSLASESIKVVSYLIKNYAISRLQAIALQRGELPERRSDLMGAEAELFRMVARAQRAEGNGLDQGSATPFGGADLTGDHLDPGRSTAEDLS